MKRYWLIPIVLSFFVMACGGFDLENITPETAVPDNTETLTGVFIDAPVQGLTYSSLPSGQGGTTNEKGEFDYINGDTVAFALGGIELGKAMPGVDNQVKVTQLPKSIQIAQLLQTLDNHADENRIDVQDISIPEDVATAIKAKLQDATGNEDILSTEALEKIKASNPTRTALTSKTNIVTQEEVLDHVTKQIGKQGLAFNVSELANNTFIDTSLLLNRKGDIYSFGDHANNSFDMVNVLGNGNFSYTTQTEVAKTFSVNHDGTLALTSMASNPVMQAVCTLTKLLEDGLSIDLKYTCTTDGKADIAYQGLANLLKTQAFEASDLNGKTYTYKPYESSATDFRITFHNDGHFSTTQGHGCDGCTYTQGRYRHSVKLDTGSSTMELLLVSGTIDHGALVALTYDKDGHLITVEVMELSDGKNLTVVYLANQQDDTYQTPIWQPNLFADAAIFKDRCAAPRAGFFHQGNTYPDKQGSHADEKFWLRSWSHDTYLWYNEIADVAPTGTDTPQAYFDLLKTRQTTVTGAPKDKYHYYENTEAYNEYAESGVSFSYGLRFQIIRSAPPRKGVVVYVVEGSPAHKAGIARGDEYVEINGENLQNGSNIDKLNSGLFPNDKSPTHTFKFRRLNGVEYDVTMTGEAFTAPSVLVNDYTSLVDSAGKSYAYLMLNTFGTHKAEADLYNAFNNIAQHEADTGKQINELVLDLRYNGGGYVYISSQLAYAVAGNNVPTDSYYNRSTFNDKNPITNPITGKAIQSTPFYKMTYGDSGEVAYGLPLDAMHLDRVFILSTGRTCSASELLINGLIGIGVDVVLIGETTCGKPYGFYPTDNCGTTYNTIQFKSANYKGFGDYSDGFIPTDTSNPQLPYIQGCKVEDDFTHQLGDPKEALLNTALNYDTKGCPAVPAASMGIHPIPQSFGPSLMDDPRMQLHEMKHNSAILIERPTGVAQ